MGSDTYTKSLAMNLYEFQQKGVYCDIIIQLEDCRMMAHRVVLAAASPRLRSIIGSPRGADLEKDVNVNVNQIIEMRDYSSSDARLWLEFMYTGKTNQPNSFKQLQEVLSLFETLEMPKPNWTIDSIKPCLVKSELNQAVVKSADDGIHSYQVHEGGDCGSEIGAKEMEAINEMPKIPCECAHGSLLRDGIQTDNKMAGLHCSRCKGFCTDFDHSQNEFIVAESNNEVTDVENLTSDQGVEIAYQNRANSESNIKKELGDFVLNSSCSGSLSCNTSCQVAENSQNKECEDIQKVVALTQTNKRCLPAKKGGTIFHKKLTKQEIYDCNHCGRTFSSKQAFQNHVKVHTDGRPYKCTICGDSFRFPKRLSRHTWLFHRVSICEKCGPDCHCSHAQKTKTNKDVRFTCEVCNKTFARYQSMRDHQAVHSGEAPLTFICEICGKSFKQKGQLSLHQAVHSSKPYACHVCNRVFVSSVLLEEHTRKHTGECPIQCDTCGKRFRSRKALRIHLDKHVGVVHQCDICGRQFSSKSYLLMHVDGHTNGRSRSHKCDFCDKAFFDKNSLRKHHVIHDEVRDRPFVCSTCGKSFLSKGSLKTHAAFHGDERPYKCSTCTKSFKLKSHFNRHVKIHQKSKDSGEPCLEDKDTEDSVIPNQLDTKL